MDHLWVVRLVYLKDIGKDPITVVRMVDEMVAMKVGEWVCVQAVG